MRIMILKESGVGKMRKRRYLLLSLMGATMFNSRTAAQDKRPTAREVVAAIQEHVGVPWQPIAKRTMYGEDGRPGTWGNVGKPGSANPKPVWPF